MFCICASLSCKPETFNGLLIFRLLSRVAEGLIITLMMNIMIRIPPSHAWQNTGLINLGEPIISIALGPIIFTQITARYHRQPTFLVATDLFFVLTLLATTILRNDQVDTRRLPVSILKLYAESLQYRNVMLCTLVPVFSNAGY